MSKFMKPMLLGAVAVTMLTVVVDQADAGRRRRCRKIERHQCYAPPPCYQHHHVAPACGSPCDPCGQQGYPAAPYHGDGYHSHYHNGYHGHYNNSYQHSHHGQAVPHSVGRPTYSNEPVPTEYRSNDDAPLPQERASEPQDASVNAEAEAQRQQAEQDAQNAQREAERQAEEAQRQAAEAQQNVEQNVQDVQERADQAAQDAAEAVPTLE